MNLKSRLTIGSFYYILNKIKNKTIGSKMKKIEKSKLIKTILLLISTIPFPLFFASGKSGSVKIIRKLRKLL